SSTVITIITDFGVHPFWVSQGTDLYIVASDFTRDKLLVEGIAQEKIKVFGLPSDAKFLRGFNRASLAVKLGIRPDKFTVLLMTGSFGIGPLEELAALLCRDMQVLVVCAANKKLYARLNKRNLPNVKVFGFVNNTEELMGVCDIIVTKPGGSTIAEVLNMGLVPVFISVIPGQEEGNVAALEEFGVSLTPKTVDATKDIILEFKNNPEKLQEMQLRVQKLKKPFSCQELAGVIR
ncbi:MAG: glycosyltransferase, partial [Candidatus Omnitrophica bacterium]|nr:glycosyltransferase [Candidatus Omnitrophota bacterium]